MFGVQNNNCDGYYKAKTTLEGLELSTWQYEQFQLVYVTQLAITIGTAVIWKVNYKFRQSNKHNYLYSYM